MSKVALFQVEIPRRARVCAAGEHSLGPGDAYASVLIEGKKGELVRHDYCIACWEEGAEARWKEAGQSCWRGVVPQKEKRQLPEDQSERALVLFKEALAEEGEAKAAEAFILALFLVRKKAIALRKELKREGKRIQIYEILSTEEMVQVERFDLASLPVTGIQSRIASQLRG